MGCCGGARETQEEVRTEHKWDYFNLADFRSSSCWAPFSYGILYVTIIISIAVYIVDIFTAVQLLLFDRWSGKIEPKVPLYISRWIFAGCIMLSWVLLIYRFIRATRVMRTGGVAQSYLDPLAVRIQSIRMGERGQGWRRFLVFASLTKSKKGVEYIALFTYFSFEAWLRIVFAEGPRQAINAMTLASVIQSDVIPSGDRAASAGHTPIVQFFINVKILADQDRIRATIFFGMLFTLIIWIFAALSLISACLFYILFLWRHIAAQDGSLAKYCGRKIDGRLQVIVDAKIRKALAKEDMKRSKQGDKFAKSGEPRPGIRKQPTLPVLVDDKLSNIPLSRQTTQSTLPPYSVRPEADDKQPTLPKLETDFSNVPRGTISRTATQSTDTSYRSDAPLIGSAAAMQTRPHGAIYESPLEMGPERFDRGRDPMGRSLTGSTQASQHSMTPAHRPPMPGMGSSRQNTRVTDVSQGNRFTPQQPVRQNTGMSNYSVGRSTPGSFPGPNSGNAGSEGDGRHTPFGSLMQRPGGDSYQVSGRPTPNGPSRQNIGMNGYSQNDPNAFANGPRSALAPMESYGRWTPAQPGRQPPIQEYGMRSQTSQRPSSRPGGNPGFVAYNPNMNGGSAPSANATRNFSAPNRSAQKSRPTAPQRSGTAPPMPTAGYNDSI